MIRIITTNEKFKELEKDWNDLYNSKINKTPFQSFVFNWSSWNNFLKHEKLNKIWIWSLRNANNKTIAIVPLYIDKTGILRFINDLHLDFADGLFAIDEQLYFTIKKLSESIQQDKNIKGLKLSNLTDKSVIFPYIKCFLKQSFTYSSTEHSYLPFIKENKIELSSHLRSRERNSLEKANQHNKHSSFELLRVQEHPFPYDELIEIRNTMHQNGSRVLSFFGEEFLQICEDLYNSDLMVISLTKEESRVIAMSTMIYDPALKWYMFWISMYNDKHKMVNIHNYNKVIEECLNDKENTIDFGRGGYDYKFKNYFVNLHIKFDFRHTISFLSKDYKID